MIWYFCLFLFLWHKASLCMAVSLSCVLNVHSCAMFWRVTRWRLLEALRKLSQQHFFRALHGFPCWLPLSGGCVGVNSLPSVFILLTYSDATQLSSTNVGSPAQQLWSLFLNNVTTRHSSCLSENLKHSVSFWFALLLGLFILKY